MENEYLTVGQLAREVGTTVRTIQYYDQQGLLSPSTRSAGGQRLYDPSSADELYRILTLKYLGLTLADIKEAQGSITSSAEFSEIVLHTLEEVEEDFQELVKRLSVLRSLLDQAGASKDVDWAGFARTIGEGQDDPDLFWHRIDEIPAAETDAAAADEQRRITVGKWHELIADTITLLSARAAADSPEAAELAQRFRQLEAEQPGSLQQMFVLAENVSPHHGAPGSFNVLRDSVEQFLADALAALGGGDA